VVTRQIAFYVDATRCINCKTCEVACKDASDSAVGRRLRKVRTFEGGEFPAVFAYNISMACNHCEDPACVRQCPAKAYTKRESDGIVIHDPEKCIGCRYCTWVCPYGAPQYDASEGRVRKCNLCVEELDRGGTPACVFSCPLRAIEIAPLDEIVQRPGATTDILSTPSAELTKPSIRYSVRKEAQRD
jgi:anaerobic dimethyl sulfoxide reductase subunit B (iron-sulfur subunit)